MIPSAAGQYESIVLIDNYDSFTYNLADQLRRLLGAEQRLIVLKNDQATDEQIFDLNPALIVISPGPGNENNGGVCLKVLTKASEQRTPVLGVCLGHQLIVHWCGGKIVRAIKPVHGHADRMFYKSQSVFSAFAGDLFVGRYHSLVACWDSIPQELDVIAWSEEQEVMAIVHRDLPWVGVQFHPESFLTTEGDRIISAFLTLYVNRSNTSYLAA
jgi:anthranilate synthase/aminodeoxychorismate synthase-like glutamine amidotransferase